MKIDAPSMIGRATGAIRKHARSFGIGGAEQRTETVDPRPVLMWLAGAGYRPKEIARNKGMVPVPRDHEETAERILATTKPDDPTLAARMRADILANLHSDAPGDPRTREIFDADPVIVADPDTGWLVTESMLQARIALFDSLNALLQKPYLTEDACAEMRATLGIAFRDLTPESQREWCHSEMRLEQGLAFVESRGENDLIALAEALEPVEATRGVWDAMRLFSVAARMGDPGDEDDTPIAGLLTVGR